jgi:hypothetical protein
VGRRERVMEIMKEV